jgi:ATP-dependent Zn protease
MTANQKITFKDVAGVEEARELQEIIDFLKEREIQRLGGRIQRCASCWTAGHGADTPGSCDCR